MVEKDGVDYDSSMQPERVSVVSSPDSDDALLLRRLQAGGAAAFERLVRDHGPRMLAAIRRYLPHDQDAQDALQDAFVSVFKGIANFQGDSQLATWLHRVAVNAALQLIRRKKSRPERSIDELLPQFLSDGHRANPGPAWPEPGRSAGIDDETKELVRRCIDQLPELYRTVLILRDIEQKSREEVCEILEIGLANVKMRLHRARQALRELLDRQLAK